MALAVRQPALREEGEKSVSSEAIPVFSSVLLQTGAYRSNSHPQISFLEFKAKHGHTYDGEEHRARERIFHRRVREIHAHNERLPQHSWRAGINWLSDRTEEELLQLRGYRRHRKHVMKPSSASTNLIHSATCSGASQACHSGADSTQCCNGLLCGAHGHCEQAATADKLPVSIDWSTRLAGGQRVLNQGQCGSCWAIAAQGAIEMQAAKLSNTSVELSAQGLLGCTPNPHECGGTGGCKGATPQLAYDWAKEYGVDFVSRVPYTAETSCPTSFMSKRPAVYISGFVTLEVNKAEKVLAALVSVGPMAVAVAASDWTSYMGGIYDSCTKNPVVDHAVLLVGYGKAGKGDGVIHSYWKIRNSWGEDYGESGFIRLRRHAHGKEPCSWDHEPDKGVGCKGGPKKLWVCGECGVLSDVNYPVGTTIPEGI